MPMQKYVRLAPSTLYIAPECYGRYDSCKQSSCPVAKQCASGVVLEFHNKSPNLVCEDVANAVRGAILALADLGASRISVPMPKQDLTVGVYRRKVGLIIVVKRRK